LQSRREINEYMLYRAMRHSGGPCSRALPHSAGQWTSVSAVEKNSAG
jgi:hypothetical protein